jgi:RHS repeat-associated protein
VLQTGTSSTTIYPFKWYSVASSTATGAKYATTTEYVFNGDTLLSTVDQQIAGGAATGTAQTRYIHPDHLGSTNVVTNASGTVVQTLDYYPYGATRISSGQNATRRQYVNRFADESSLDYMTNRFYDPNRGQFISQDPMFWSQRQNLMNPQSLNSYSYANDNPITGKDPDGLASSNTAQIIGLIQQAISAIQQMISILSGGGSGGGSVAGARTSGSGGMPGPVMVTGMSMPMRSTTWDSTTNKRIQELDPRVRKPATDFINQTDDWLGEKLRVTEELVSEICTGR